MTEKKTPETLLTVDHPFLNKLLEKHGTGETGRLLGLSATAFSPSSIAKGVRPAYELAAKQVWLQSGGHEPPARTYIMKISEPHNETVEKVVRALGGRLIAIQF